MGDAFITRRGGGIKEGYALIAVTYPSGSVCTCMNGSKTLKAKDTSGAFCLLSRKLEHGRYRALMVRRRQVMQL